MRKELRVRKNEEFSKIIAEKHSFSNGSFVIYARKRKLEHARVGISVSKKLGNAVIRNKIKRQVRMMLLDVFDFDNEKNDLICIVRPKYIEKSYIDNKSELEKLIKKAIID